MRMPSSWYAQPPNYRATHHLRRPVGFGVSLTIELGWVLFAVKFGLPSWPFGHEGLRPWLKPYFHSVHPWGFLVTWAGSYLRISGL